MRSDPSQAVTKLSHLGLISDIGPSLDIEDAVVVDSKTSDPKTGIVRRRTWGGDGPGNLPALSKAISVERVATTVGTVFVLGKTRAGAARQPSAPPRPTTGLPMLSKQVTIGRNSQFLNLTSSDRERLGGIEYRALKVLLKIVVCKSLCASAAPHNGAAIFPC